MIDAAMPAGNAVVSDRPQMKMLNLVWALTAIGGTVAVIVTRDSRLTNFVHVLAGLLWTGVDLFMGFVLGPIMRCLDMQARTSAVLRLMPKMVFYMPTLAVITPTADFCLAPMMGYLNVGYPQFWWTVAVCMILAILAIQVLGILLPTNLRVCFGLRKKNPEGQKIRRLMRNDIRIVATGGNAYRDNLRHVTPGNRNIMTISVVSVPLNLILSGLVPH